MEYPGTKFTKPIRQFMFIFFISAFFIISPLLIMYTAGYRYDWHNGLLKETGSISIDIEPQESVAYLNNIKLQKTLPIRLNNITPATYNTRLSAEGYLDWSKEIEVKNKQTNYIKEIRLIKKPKLELAVSGAMNDFSVSADGAYILFTTQTDKSFFTWLWNVRTQEKTQITGLDSSLRFQYTWDEKNNLAVIAPTEQPLAQIYILNAETKKLFTINSGTPITKFIWNQTSEPQVYYSTKNQIFLYTPTTNKSQPVTANTYLDWSVEASELWTLQFATNTDAYIITKDILGFPTIVQTVSKTYFTTNDQPNSNKPALLKVKGNTALIGNLYGKKAILANQNGLHPIDTTDFFVSPYNNWWLLWSQWELWTYSDGEEPQLLSRSGEQLHTVLPLDQYNTLALIWNQRSTILFPYYLVSHELIAEQIHTAHADTKNKILYFTSKTKDGIWKTDY